MAAKNVRFHEGGKFHVEPISTFAKANGTDVKGARRILQLWEGKGWIVRRPDGGFDVKNRRPRQDPWTMQALAAEGYPTPVNGARFDLMIYDEAQGFPGA